MCFANSGPSSLNWPMLFDTSRCVSDLIIEFIRKILDSTALGTAPVTRPTGASTAFNVILFGLLAGFDRLCQVLRTFSTELVARHVERSDRPVDL